MKCFFYSFRTMMKRGKAYSTVYFLFSYLLIATSVLQMIFTQKLVNLFTYYDEKLLGQISWCIGVLVVILYIEGLMTSLRGVCLSYLKERGIYEDENIILSKSCNLEIKDLDSPEIKNLRDSAKRFSFFDTVNSYVDFSVVVIKVFIYCFIVIYYKCILLLPVILFGLLVKARLQKKGDCRVEQMEFEQVESNRIRDYLYNLLVNCDTLQEIKITDNANYLNDKRADIYTKNYDERIKVIKESELKLFGIGSVITICNILSLCLLVILARVYGIAAGEYVLLMQVIAQLYSLFPSVSQGYGTVKSLMMRFDKYLEYMQLQENQSIVSDKKVIEAIGVSLKDVSFRYPGGSKDAINMVSIEIKPRQRIALVGENGSGKSTLVKIILGIYLPDRGAVRWYDNDGASKEVINSRFKVVFQDFIKLLRPIRENVAMGNIKKVDDDEAIWKAIHRAGNEKIVYKLDKYIGPEFGGIDLSGGQWQKLSIARSYMRNCGLAIFDEATSALDAKAELQQYQSFYDQSKDITSIIVTHRLSLARFVDKIYVIHNGEIVESGSHEELYKMNGRYRKMYDAQSAFYT